MTGLRVSWLGTPLIELDGQPIHLETRKATALLAYCCLNPQSFSREVLANLFWPDYDQKHTQANLRRSLYGINRSLQVDVLIAGGKTIQAHDQIPIWQDVHEFQHQLASCQSHPHQDLETCDECLGHLERSVALYRGDFLAGLNLPDCPEFDEWQYLQRESYRTAFAQALCGLVKAYETRQEWEKALQHARHWVTLDRLNEAAQRILINLYARSGQRSAALRQYEALTRLLQEELGQPPEEQTTALYKRIQTGNFQAEIPEKPASPPVPRTQGNETLLKTKLFIPPIRVDRVPRPRLLELLNAGSQRALTLISAPAGFGKTTLLAHWTTQTELPIAWYSLDENDNDPTRFVSYLIAALDSIIPTIGEQYQGTYQSLLPSIQPVLVGLINDLTTAPEPFVLVLDDYQFIHSPVVHEGLAFLLDKIPACMHLVIATRTDPPMPLARLRARDQLVEIRASDLRFTQEESAGFLHQVMSLDLTSDDVVALETRTEGWIAGLQMAALAIRAIGNPKQVPGVEASSAQMQISGFIQAFSGSHRYILDYLGEEVINRCPAEIRRFLLQTSLLERFSGPLCAAVTGMAESQTILETLEKENIFLVPLDNERAWYRYHHLFAELLRYQLNESLSKNHGGGQDASIPLEQLHIRAADWLESHNLIGEAVQHILAAKQFDRAADLIEGQAHAMLFNKGQAYTLYQWLAALPPEQFRLRPRLSILHAWTLFSQSQFAAAQEPLNAAWEAVQGRQGPEVDRILGEVALAWGVLSQLSLRDTETMRKQALLAWEKLPPDDQMLRGIAAWLLGSSYYWDGDMIHGEEYFRRATHLCQQAGNIYFTLVSIVDLATTIREQGRFREAYQLLLQTEQEMTSGGRQPHPILGQLYIFSGQFLLQWNELEAAEQHLMRGIDLVSRDIPGEILFFGMSTLPYLKLAQGDREEAVRLALDCIERVQSYPLPYVPPLIRSNLVRFWMRVGDRRRVEEWVSTCGRTSEDTILYPYESQYTTLAKVMIWQGRGKEGLKLLAKLAPPEQLAYRKGKIFYIWALQAMALRQSNDLDGALIMLKNSLSLAQPEGYIRPYVDEGQPMEDLLARGTAQGIWRQASLDGYVDSLMTAFEKERTQSAAALEVTQGIPPFQTQPGRTDGMELVETLSERELDVLRLAAQGLSNPEIGNALNLSEGTIKTHLHHVFGKWGVKGRIQAIALAKEWHLI